MKASLRLLRLFVAAAAILSLAAFVFAMPASATHGQPGKQLPLQGVQTGSGILEPAPGFPFERSMFDGRCSVPSDALSSWDYTGTWTHLGSWTTVEISHCSQLDLATGVGTFGDGVFTLRAANGDTLSGTYGNGESVFQPDGTVAYTFEMTITGGTGRFAGATGHISASGLATEFDTTVTPWTATVVETSYGWIAYDASQESGQ